MGAIGRYLEALPDDARDRIIEAKDWRFGGPSYADTNGARCLVGHAGDYAESEVADKPRAEPPAWLDKFWEWRFVPGKPLRPSPASRFDRACARFGKDRVVRAIKARAIKARAARPNRIVVHTPERTPASVEG